MPQYFFVFAGTSGALAVALGAFGAHALKGRLSPELLDTYQTAVNYQLTHTLALMVVALLAMRFVDIRSWEIAGYFYITGIILFCGSLYGLSLLGWRWLGPVTPLGGLCFIAAWLLLTVAAWRSSF